MAKIAWMLLAACLLGLLPGCTAQPPYNREVLVLEDKLAGQHIIRVNASNGRYSGTGGVILELLEQYQQQEQAASGGRQVAIDWQDTPLTSMLDHTRLLAASNDLPDLFSYESGKALEDFADAGLVLDIEAVFQELGLDPFLDPTTVNLLKSMVKQNKLYALPLEKIVEGFWYNKSLFAEYAISVPATWEEMIAAARRFQQLGIQPFAIAGREKWPITRLINGYATRYYGPDIMEQVAKGTRKVTEPGFIQAAQLVKQMAQEGLFGEQPHWTDFAHARKLFLSGQAAMYYSGSWELKFFNQMQEEALSPEEIGLFNIPLVEGGVGTPDEWQMNAGLTMSLSSSQFTEESAKWIRYVFQRYGEHAMREQGLITGFKATAAPESKPLTQMVQRTIDSISRGVLWFEARFDPQTQTVAWNNAQLLISVEGYSAKQYMEELQAAIDAEQGGSITGPREPDR